MNVQQSIGNFVTVNQKSITLFEKGRKIMKARIFFAAVLIAVFCAASLSYADVPRMIDYQGMLTTSGGEPLDTTVSMVFRLYEDPTTSTDLWTETQDPVIVEYGVFSVLLGSVDPIPDSVFDGSIRYLGVRVGADGEMSPRKPVVSGGYAFRSGFSDTAAYAQTGAADDDWVVHGDTIYHYGNVGIGTSNPAEKLDVEGNIHATGSIFSGNSIGIETLDGAGPDRLVASGPVIYLDQESPWGSNNFTGNIKVGIATPTPQAPLHVKNSTLANNETAVQVDFGSSNDNISTQGIVAESDLMTVRGVRVGVKGMSSISFSGIQIGEARGELGHVSGWVGNSQVTGVRGGSEPSNLYNAGSGSNSFGLGGRFWARPPASGLNLSATGTYYVGGVYATADGEVNGGNNAIVAGVIGEDNSTGNATSYAGYFTSNKSDPSATAVYGRSVPASGWGVGGDFDGGYAGVTGEGGVIGVDGRVVNNEAGARYGVRGYSYGSLTTSIPYGVYGHANGNTTAYGVYGGAGGVGPNIWAGYFSGRVYAQGDVGIGTSNPAEKLDVDGNIHASGTIKSGNSLTLYGAGHDLLTSSGAISFLRDPTTGDIQDIRVGIGSTSPVAPLDVITDYPYWETIGLFRYTGTDAKNVRGVAGYSDPQDHYGIGGEFLGGYIGSRGVVYPTGGADYYGLWGAVHGGSGTNHGVYGYATGAGTNYAGYFEGDVKITGAILKSAGGSKIDHPLDPANKYLNHSSVESPDMMNVYNGNAVLDAAGEAGVELPDYFEALNRDFRYQLTCIGGFAPVYVAEKISGNRFKVAGGEPGMEISWQVTGIRKDAFAEANRIEVEVDKSGKERGKYLHPEAYGLGEEFGIHYEEHKRMKEQLQEKSAQKMQPR